MKQPSFYDWLWTQERRAVRRYDTQTTDELNPPPADKRIKLAQDMMRLKAAAESWLVALGYDGTARYERLDFYVQRLEDEITGSSNNG